MKIHEVSDWRSGAAEMAVGGVHEYSNQVKTQSTHARKDWRGIFVAFCCIENHKLKKAIIS